MRILAEAIDCPDSERAAFLERACGSDASLRSVVEHLLARRGIAERFLEDPVLEPTLPDADGVASLIGQNVGPYRIASEIGRGGMAAVYLAVRSDDEFQRRVAIKVIKRGMDSDAI